MSSEENKSKQFSNTMPKKVYNSSTPIKPIFDPVSKNSNTTTNCSMKYEKIYPGIYLTSVKDLCSPDDLKIYGFTHIIYIDKHVMQNSNGLNLRPSSSINCNDKNYGATSITASITIRQTSELSTNQNQCTSQTSIKCILHESVACSSSASSTSMLFNCQEMPIDEEPTTNKPFTLIANNENLFGHCDFETLDLNFGESSYLTTVLPNCYKAVKFIEKALKMNGAVLVIDCIGESQKCTTIVIGFLMYKYNKNFLTAYQLMKRLHPNIELDKFFTTQLYEYEPILQVQRSQLLGNSCSRELRSALLKRKKTYDDCYYYQSDATTPTLLPHNSIICSGPDNLVNNVEHTTDILMEQ